MVKTHRCKYCNFCGKGIVLKMILAVHSNVYIDSPFFIYLNFNQLWL